MEALMKRLFALVSLLVFLAVVAKAQDQAVIQCQGQMGIQALEEPGSLVVLKLFRCGQTVAVIGSDEGYAKIQVKENIVAYVDGKYVRLVQTQRATVQAVGDLETQTKISPPKASAKDSAKAEKPVTAKEAPPIAEQRSKASEPIASPNGVVYIKGKRYRVTEQNGISVMVSADQEDKYLVLNVLVSNSTSKPISVIPSQIVVKDLFASKTLDFYSPDTLASNQRKSGSWKRIFETVGGAMQAYGAAAPRSSTSYSNGSVHLQDQYGNSANGRYSGTSTTYTSPSPAEVSANTKAINDRMLAQRQLRQEENEIKAASIENTALFANTLAPGSQLGGNVHFSKARIGSINLRSGKLEKGFAVNVTIPIEGTLFDFAFPITDISDEPNK
jgi:hypothetical protein